MSNSPSHTRETATRWYLLTTSPSGHAEVFSTLDQSALTIAKLVVEHIISRHGVPRELLSDRGPAFLSKLLQEICKSVKKTHTTAYHPQTYGLVERFNPDMLAKTVEKNGKDWDA